MWLGVNRRGSVEMDAERKCSGVDGMWMLMEGYEWTMMSVWVCGYMWRGVDGMWIVWSGVEGYELRRERL